MVVQRKVTYRSKSHAEYAGVEALNLAQMRCKYSRDAGELCCAYVYMYDRTSVMLGKIKCKWSLTVAVARTVIVTCLSQSICQCLARALWRPRVLLFLLTGPPMARTIFLSRVVAPVKAVVRETAIKSYPKTEV